MEGRSVGGGKKMQVLQKGKGVCSWKLGLEMPGRVGVYVAGRDRQFHMRVVEKETLA